MAAALSERGCSFGLSLSLSVSVSSSSRAKVGSQVFGLSTRGIGLGIRFSRTSAVKCGAPISAFGHGTWPIKFAELAFALPGKTHLTYLPTTYLPGAYLYGRSRRLIQQFLVYQNGNNTSYAFLVNFVL